MSIRDIVNVQITRETTAVSQVGFGTLMILGAHKVFNERIRFYMSADAILEDGFLSTDPEYVAALAAFAQSPRPAQVAIGRRTVDTVNINVSSVVIGVDYTVTINGVEFTYTSDTGDAEAQIIAGLIAEVNGGSEPVTASTASSKLVLTADVSGEAFTVTVGQRLALEKPYVASDSIQEDLTAVNSENDNWYGLVITSRDPQDVEDAAEWTEAQVKIFGTASDDADMLDALSTTDIAAVLKAGEFARTFVMYHKDASTEFPDAAWFGRMLPTPPGSATWNFKILSSISASNLTSTQRINLYAKNANSYEYRGGTNVAREGKVAEGEFIDVIIGVDWMTARLTEQIYALLRNKPKVPYTNAGVAMVEAEVRAQLDQSIAQGIISNDPAYIVTAPLVRDVPSNDRANRHLPDVRFTATLQGAIHSVQISGVVSI